MACASFYFGIYEGLIQKDLVSLYLFPIWIFLYFLFGIIDFKKE